jgi:crossover junction endodeoxyribonuclease RusA
MKITLPWPDAKLNPNQSKGAHWSVAVAARKKARTDAYWITREVLVQEAAKKGAPMAVDGSLALDITFVLPSKQQRDLDNLLAALKPSLDGVADCLGVNDTRFEPITIRRQYGGTKPGSVLVVIA